MKYPAVFVCFLALLLALSSQPVAAQGPPLWDGSSSLDWDGDGDDDFVFSPVGFPGFPPLGVWDSAADWMSGAVPPIVSFSCDPLTEYCVFSVYPENGVVKSVFVGYVPGAPDGPPPHPILYSIVNEISGSYSAAGPAQFVIPSSLTPISDLEALRAAWQADLRPYPGSNEDFVQFTGVNGPASCLPRIKEAVSGDQLIVHFESPNGSYDFTQPLLLAQLFTTGMPTAQPIGYGEAWVNPSLLSEFPVTVLFDGGGGGPLGGGSLPPGGTTLAFTVPMGLTGFSVMLQSLVFAPSVATGNTLFTLTDGHEIRIL